MALPARFDVSDLGLAGDGVERVDAASRRRPVLRAVHERLARERPLLGYRLSACLDVTAGNAVLVRALVAGGADLVLCAAGPGTTEDDVAAALVVETEVPVLAVGGEDPDRFYAHLDTACDHRPQLVIDHDGDLVGTLHAARREQLGYVLAAVEATDAGVLRAETLVAEGALAFPVVDLRAPSAVELLETRHTDAGALLDRIADQAGVSYPGTRTAVVGYGRRGRPVARRARELGARVVISELSPIRALEAALDGFDVAPLAEALAGAGVVVVATSRRHAVSREHVAGLTDGAVVVPLDGRGVSIELPGRRSTGDEAGAPASSDAITLGDGRVIRVLPGTPPPPGEAGPAAVDDVRLATLALSVERLVVSAPELDRRVYPVPAGIDDQVAAFKLLTLGIELETAPRDAG